MLLFYTDPRLCAALPRSCPCNFHGMVSAMVGAWSSHFIVTGVAVDDFDDSRGFVLDLQEEFSNKVFSSLSTFPLPLDQKMHIVNEAIKQAVID